MEHFAEIVWSVEDVQAIRPEWDAAKCAEWWRKNEKWFKDVLTEYGNEILQNAVNFAPFSGT